LNNKNRIISYAYLIIGFIFLIFANGRWILPIATFIAPTFLIRFLRIQKPLKGTLYLLLVLWISNIIIWKGMMPMSGPFYYIVCFMMSLFTSLTYLLDRIFSTKIKGIISTFIFPSLVVILEFIVTSTNPSGSFGSLAHTQSYLPILQIISVTGIWGIIFFITWTASFINWLWDNKFEIMRIQKGIVVYGLTLFVLILFGQIRMNFISKTIDTVRIASVTINKKDAKELLAVKDSVMFERISTKLGQRFLQSCEIASQSGAKLVFGQETLLNIKKSKENSFIEKAMKIALKDSIYIGLSLATIPVKKRAENKIVWISPQGKIISTYYKAKPMYGKRIHGDGKLKYFDTPYGRICSAICFDMDFPDIINQIRNKNIDIMLVPANDWYEISPYHTYVASARAIEHGFNLVRSTGHGLSASFNYKGEVISKLDYFNTSEHMMLTDIPKNGLNTVYSILGNYFAYLCILFLILISILYFRIFSSKEIKNND